MDIVKITIEKANGNGQSQCVRCRDVNWDCFMYKMIELDGRRICCDCLKFVKEENGKKE